MFKNYIKIAVRNLIRQKRYTFINIFGLAFGLACCLLISIYVRYELSFDRFHKDAGQIYRVVEDISKSNETVSRASAAGPVGPALVRDFPEVLRSVRLEGKATMLVEYNDKRFQENNIFFADSTIFDVFTFPLLEGNARTALTAPSTVVLTSSTAKRYFGNADPIGKALVIDSASVFTVTGVMRDIPSNSHLSFDMLVSMTTREFNYKSWSDEWFWSANTYIKLAPGHDAVSLEKKLSQFVVRHPDKDLQEKGGKRALSLQPLADIHLYSKRAGEPGTPGSVSDIYLFSFIGIFILLIACVNFVNLTTVQISRRSREVGLRKVMGGTRLQLVVQFLAESVLISFVASVFAFALCYLLLPVFTTLTGIPVNPVFLINPSASLIFLIIAMLTGCLAGSYPAFALSNFRIASILKGPHLSSAQGSLLRKGLIVFQFSISIILIAGTITVFSQLRYIQNKDLGYSQEQKLILYFGDDEHVQTQVEYIKEELLRSSYITKAAASSHIPGKQPGTTQAEIEDVNGTREEVEMHLLSVDYDFIPLYGLKLAAGRMFSSVYNSDASNGFMINEAAVHKLGFRHPEKVVGKQISLGENTGTVIGVVKDFNYTSLHKVIEPLVFRMRSKSLSYISLSVRPDAIDAALSDLEQRWHVLAPHRPFDYFFLDEQFGRQYQADKQFGQIFGIFSMIAIVLACLGLFGLVSFIVQQRTKEIGVRKVLGASVTGVAGLISRDFIRLVLIAIFIATPAAWYAMNKWLHNFAYRIDLHWWIFVSAGVLTVSVAMLTISFQAVKAARANPVKSLKAE